MLPCQMAITPLLLDATHSHCNDKSYLVNYLAISQLNLVVMVSHTLEGDHIVLLLAYPATITAKQVISLRCATATSTTTPYCQALMQSLLFTISHVMATDPALDDNITQ